MEAHAYTESKLKQTNNAILKPNNIIIGLDWRQMLNVKFNSRTRFCSTFQTKLTSYILQINVLYRKDPNLYICSFDWS